MKFVTAFLDLREDRSVYRTTKSSLEYFDKLASTGIDIVCFMSKELCKEIKYKNVTVIEFELEDTSTYKIFRQQKNTKLPCYRNLYKDTINYMLMQNSKIEFVNKALSLFPDEKHFAWIDFNIFHVIRDPINSSIILKNIQERPLVERLLLFSGCLNTRIPIEHKKIFFDQILWRFCGGFFIGDRESLQKLYYEYINFFPNIFEKHNLTWETNIWAYMESIGLVEFDFFQGDHNDSIIQVPNLYFK